VRNEYDFGRFFSEGWRAFKDSMGALVVGYLMYAVVVGLTNIIPGVGSLLGFAITGPMMGGLSMLALDALDGDQPKWSRIFDGFNNFTPLFLAFLTLNGFMFLVAIVVMIPATLFLVGGGALAGGLQDPESLDPNVMAPVMGGFLLAMLFLLIAVLLLMSWYVYTFFFIVDRDYSFWDAMEASRAIWFAAPIQTTLFVIATGLLMGSGVFLFFIGILWTYPLGFCVLAVAYRHLSGQAQGNSAAGSTAARTFPPPPPIPTPDLGDIPARSGETIMIPPPVKAAPPSPPASAPEYLACYVFVENHQPSEEIAHKIATMGAKEAADRLPLGGIVGIQVDAWPTSDEELSTMVKENIAARNASHADTHRHHITVWKGRDKKSGKNMATATVSTR
jgi:uncharacterized membrane protein